MCWHYSRSYTHIPSPPSLLPPSLSLLQMVAFFVTRESGSRCLDSRQALLMKEIEDKVRKEGEEGGREGPGWMCSMHGCAGPAAPNLSEQ